MTDRVDAEWKLTRRSEELRGNGMTKKIRVPTYEEYASHDGLHYHQLWAEVGPHWVCPGCGRSRFQIMRWTKRFPNSPGAFWGWVAGLQRHHCHSMEFRGNDSPRFSRTIVCDQCNATDGAVKRKFQLPKKFSFAPEEIRGFVMAIPHGKHTIDYEKALEVYRRVMGGHHNEVPG